MYCIDHLHLLANNLGFCRYDNLNTTKLCLGRWVSLLLLLCFLCLCSVCLLMCHHSHQLPHVVNASKTFLLHELLSFALSLPSYLCRPLICLFTEACHSCSLCLLLVSVLHFLSTFFSLSNDLFSRDKNANSPGLKIECVRILCVWP